jgi:hypothetical protein
LQDFQSRLLRLIKADARVDLFEWCLYRLLQVQLKPRRRPILFLDLGELRRECSDLLAAVARAGQDAEPQALVALRSGWRELGLGGEAPSDVPPELDLGRLDRVLERLRALKPLQQPRLLKALAVCILHDEQVAVAEAELLRTIAALLDCPMPPLPLHIRLAGEQQDQDGPGS